MSQYPDQPEQPTVEWMPGVAAGVATLVLSQFVWVVGTVLSAAGLLGFLVLAVRRQWRPLTWVCLGAALGGALFWAIIAANGAL